MKKKTIALAFIGTVLLFGTATYVAITILDQTSYVVNPKPDTIAQDIADGYIQKESSNVAKSNKPTESDDSFLAKREDRIGSKVKVDLGFEAEIKRYKQAAAPNDPNANQWWEQNLDANNTIWDMPAPQKQTLIAVIDTGFAMDHEEFQGRLYNNPGETGLASSENPSDLNCTDQALPLDMSCNNVDDNVDGIIDNESGATSYENPSDYNCTDQSLALEKSCNNIDDDGNGLTDDVSGWDFVNSDSSPQAGELWEADNVNTYHGTMVAGIAGANANNSVGIAGVDWNAKLLLLQSLDDDGYGDSITVGNAIKYAADQGADVINLSLGTDSPDIIILQAIEYAYNLGSVVVASAGNDGCDCMVWPARYDITISVGSYNSSNTRSSFSSYGETLDIVAPGSSITTSFYSSANRTTGYSTGSGTSFAAPVVSGLVSLLKAQHPDATPLQLTALVTEQASKTINSGQHKTNQTGYGSISFTNSRIRALNGSIFEQIYKFAPVTNGGVFYGNNRQVGLYACPTGKNGTIPVYKSTNSKFFYSVNPTDLRYATSNSFSNARQFYACVLMPHDQTNTARQINLSAETSNSSYKSLIDF